MSIYGYFCCHDCRQLVWLGKAIWHEDYRPLFYHIGSETENPHWSRPELNQVLWKFLADHTGHRIDVCLEHDMDEAMWAYQEIGGDSDTDISFATYLAGWRGLSVSGGS
jgi:hypothetical protein